MGKAWTPPKRARAPSNATVTGDAQAQRIASHTPLVRRLARQIHRRAPQAVDLEELVQTGMVALVEAAQQWVDQGHAFGSYAQIRIRGAMIDFIRHGATMSRGAIIRKREVEGVRIRLMGELLRMPSDAEMADALGLSASQWLALQRIIAPPLLESLDQMLPGDSDSLTDPTEDADVALIRAEGARLLSDAIAALPERQALVLQLYFVEELSLDEIGAVLSISAARVCQIKKSALDRLRATMHDDG